ncbi:PiggyBac transposable element-derived protein 2 [Labeo rohita]|uniref:PiggyBac transposable element-derived protein 2 n=1 Tax=Labeo rohita TaxID=84645 RepID=A0ABQ8LD46_LABRO|nr:PiggyBac transposable element-derived protein 2 [Labeo rohita]
MAIQEYLEQLEEEEEEDDEEWVPQAMHDDGSSDSSDEEDYQEESVVQSSTEVEVPTTQDTIKKQSVKDNAKKKEYRWRKKQFQPPSVGFIASDEEGTEDRCNWTPYMYFKQFVTDEMLQETAEQTNLYSVQKEGKSINTTAKELEQVLGMYMHMGLVQMSCVRAYWEMETKLPAVCDVMFLKLLTLIHFQDNFSGSLGHGYKNCENSFFAYLLKNVMQ